MFIGETGHEQHISFKMNTILTLSGLLSRVQAVVDTGNFDFDNIEIHRYRGRKQPPMPPSRATRVGSLKTLAYSTVVVRRVSDTDLRFLEDVLTLDYCPEFNGWPSPPSQDKNAVPTPD